MAAVEDLHLADGAAARVGEEAVLAADTQSAQSRHIRRRVSYRV